MPVPNAYWHTDRDSACRFRDTIALHQIALTREELLSGRYMAVRLADGGSDGTAYDSRESAIKASVMSPSRCGYFQIPMERLGEKECDVILWYYRKAYDSGIHEDPAHALIVPNRKEDFYR